jgi:hypothetical protein
VPGKLALRSAQLALKQGEARLQRLLTLGSLSLTALGVCQQRLGCLQALYGHQRSASAGSGALSGQRAL